MIEFLLAMVVVLVCAYIGMYYSEESYIKVLDSLLKKQSRHIAFLEREIERLKDELQHLEGELQASIEDSDIIYQDYCEVMRLWHDEG